MSRKTKKVKVVARGLTDIAIDIRTELRTETTSLLKVGRLLVEAKAQLKHGKWLPWLEREVVMSERSAQKYMKAATFAAKYAPSSDFDEEGIPLDNPVEALSPSAIYDISSGDELYTPTVIAAILEEAKTKEVDRDRAREIAQALLQPKEEPPSPETPDPPEEIGPVEPVLEATEPEPEEGETEESEPEPETETVELGPEQTEQEAEDEAEAILDGPSPPLPPAAPPASTPGEVSVLSKFEQGVELLRDVMTKPASKFRATYLSAADLESVADFLKSVATTRTAKAA